MVPDNGVTAQAAAELLHDLAGVLDPVALGQRAATRLADRIELPMVSLALHDSPTGVYAMHCAHGARTAALRQIRVSRGKGVGGRALVDNRTFAVEDYATDPRITGDFRSIIGNESLHGVAGVPLSFQGATPAILYGGKREWGRPDDRAIAGLETCGRVLAPLLATAMATQEQARLRVGEERQRIAGALHDDVGQLLFAIGAAARRARQLQPPGNAELATEVERIERLAGEATGRLRDVLQDLTPSRPLDRLPVSVQRDLDDFRDRTGIVAHLLLPRSPSPVPPAVERAALACLRQALFNIERHAAASLVIVAVDFEAEALSLVVQDDGQGPPDGFEPNAVPAGGHHWGSTSMLREVQRLGGSLEFGRGEEGGARLRVRLPLPDLSCHEGLS